MSKMGRLALALYHEARWWGRALTKEEVEEVRKQQIKQQDNQHKQPRQ